ncbi:MAG: chemotaxis protein CheW, partial [Rhizobiales bacterium]|nr:chemotaxis protein CheW [Hyphomicrobiales bacterium]
DGVMKTRMQPIASAWQRLPRMVRDLGRLLGKSIVLQTYGEDTELDRQVLDLVRDPLTHMVRNAADHGLEMPDERRERRKAATGTIRLSARHEGAHILIEIADDGRGLNTARIREKALAAGLATPAQLERMTDAQAQRFIFSPGFSTAAAVTSISGRGVGMDVVKANIEQIGGSVEVTSIAGAGTAFLLRIPLTLAIVSALIVQADGERYAVPQLAVSELVRARAGTEARIERIKGAAILRLRERLLPLLHLGGVFATGTDDPAQDDGRLVVVMQAGGQPFGVAVDRIFHTEEIVVKPLASALRDIGFFSGNTILGDGSVILILDPNGLAETLGDTTEIVRELAQLMPVPAAAAEPTVPLLVFRAGSRDPKAVPLSLVTRLEEVAPERIESADGREMIQYRDRLMPVVRIAPPAATGQGAQPLLVVAHESAMMGILVDEIVDIVEAPARVALPSARPGSLGSAVLNGRATEMIDVGHFVAAAFPDGAPAPLGPGARSGLPLLLVDDSPFFRDMLRPLLQAAGYTVSVVASGEEA